MVLNFRHNPVLKVVAELTRVVGEENITTNLQEIRRATDNSLGIRRHVAGILRPEDLEEVVEIMRIANIHNLKLYPISRGRNIGYGEKLPPLEGQWVVDLSRMNKILDYSPVRGTVTVEPGVTQAQLSEFLRENGNEFWVDITGAGPDASVVGNTLEGGFGHSPKGDHRRTLRQVEVVLGNGVVFSTGTFPALGPDLSGIFVQSNFGIVTSLTLELVPVPEHFETFVIGFDHDSFDNCMTSLRQLRHQGTLSSVVHVANAMRTLTAVGDFSDELSGRLLKESDAIRFLSTPLVRAYPWNALGGLYGSHREVRAKKKVLKDAFRRWGEVRFFSGRHLDHMEKAVSSKWFSWTRTAKRVRGAVENIKAFHGMHCGVPSDKPFRSVTWRVSDPARVGLLWIGPTFEASPDEIKRFLKLVRPIYEESGREFALTLSFVEPGQLVAVLGIHFDRTSDADTLRAHSMYQTLTSALLNGCFELYRAGVLTTPGIDTERLEAITDLKQTFDPSGVVAPGRYGINPRPIPGTHTFQW